MKKTEKNSVEKFYELSKTESNKIGHLKNTLCT